MELRVAACQILTYPEPARSADKVTAWMAKAARDDVAVVAFPEACLCGYPSDPDYWKQADPAEFDSCEQRVMAAAADLDLAVILGTVHWEEGGSCSTASSSSIGMARQRGATPRPTWPRIGPPQVAACPCTR